MDCIILHSWVNSVGLSRGLDGAFVPIHYVSICVRYLPLGTETWIRLFTPTSLYFFARSLSMG